MHLTENTFDLPVYCPTLKSYKIRNVKNKHANSIISSHLPNQEYYPADLSILITPSDKVYFDEDEDIDEKLKEYCSKHPDWGIYITNCHVI